MTDSRVAIAAANNADWYSVMFDIRGLEYNRSDVAFSAVDPPPPLHSWMVALTDRDESGLDELIAANIDRPRFGIKDSFHKLDLETLGLIELFTASWIWAETIAEANTDGWDRIADPTALARWEQAWAAGEPPLPARQFPDPMLDRPDVALFGRRSATGYDAGLVANRSEDCVGLSNAFGPATGVPAAAALCADFGQGLPIVGYEQGDALAAAVAAGFETVGLLRVLVKG